MNPHTRKRNLRSGAYISTTTLRSPRFARHHYLAKKARKVWFMPIGVPRGVKVRFGENPLTHFLIFDRLCDYYLMGDDFLPRKVRKKRDGRRARREGRTVAAKEMRHY